MSDFMASAFAPLPTHTVNPDTAMNDAVSSGIYDKLIERCVTRYQSHLPKLTKTLEDGTVEVHFGKCPDKANGCIDCRMYKKERTTLLERMAGPKTLYSTLFPAGI